MNIAVLSDIHSNHIAFETCLKYLEKRDIDAYCLLGDYVGEFPGLEETIKILYELPNIAPCYIIKGNKETYQLNGLGENHPEWDAYPSTIGMIRYGSQHLTGRDLDYLKGLPVSMTVHMDGMPDLMLCHGSPRNLSEKILPGHVENKEIFADVTPKYILCGHTHRVANFTQYGKTVWNSGSVGCPLNGKSKAEFMILHSKDKQWEVEFITLDYDVEAVIKEMREKSFYETAPFWTQVSEQLLRGGTVAHGTALNRAMELCQIKYGECRWPRIPEECWQQACEELLHNRKS